MVVLQNPAEVQYAMAQLPRESKNNYSVSSLRVVFSLFSKIVQLKQKLIFLNTLWELFLAQTLDLFPNIHLINYCTTKIGILIIKGPKDLINPNNLYTFLKLLSPSKHIPTGHWKIH